jgi:hypothetical protein
VDLAIEARDGRYVGTLVAFDDRGEQGSRRIQGATCAEVAHALAFLAGLAIELGGHIEPESPPPSPPPPSPPPVRKVERVEPAAPPRAHARKPPRSTDVSVVLLEGARGGFGPGPRTSGELGVEVGAARGVFAPSARVAGFVAKSEVWGPASGPSAGTGSALRVEVGADLLVVGGRLEICPLRLGGESFVVRPCVGGEIGQVWGRGQIAVQPRRVTELWGAAEGTLRLSWFATPHFFVEASGGPVFPIVRTRYYFQPDETLYTVPVVTARGTFGFGIRF